MPKPDRGQRVKHNNTCQYGPTKDDKSTVMTQGNRYLMASTTSAAIPDDDNRKRPAATVWAIRKCESLDGPAIFTQWKDCKFFIEEQEDNDDAPLEWQAFVEIFDAVQYVLTAAGRGNLLQRPPLPRRKTTAVSHTQQVANPMANPGSAAATLPVGAINASPIVPASPVVAAEAATITATTMPAAVAPTETPRRRKRGCPRKNQLTATAAAAGAPNDLSPPPPKKKRVLKPKTSPPKPPKFPSWSTRLEQLKAYKALHGHFRVPREYDAGLYDWVLRERRRMARVIRFRRLQREQETRENESNFPAGEVDAANLSHDSPGETGAAGATAVGSDTQVETVAVAAAAASPQGQATATGARQGEAAVSSGETQDGTSNHSGEDGVVDADSNSPPAAASKSEDTKISEMDQVYADRLLEVGFIVDPEATRKSHLPWEERFSELKEYKESHDGSLDVEGNSRLEKWVKFQQNQLAKWEQHPPKPKLDKSRRQRLLELGLEPKETELPPKRVNKRTFDEMYEELVKFKEAHGHVDVPSQDKENKIEHWTKDLRNWTANLRVEFDNLKNGKPRAKDTSNFHLTPERIGKLTRLGFRLQIHTRMDFDYRAAEWLEYFTKHGKDPSRDDEKYGMIGVWCSKQRKYYWSTDEGGPSGPLTQERIDKLLSWGFDFKTKVIPQTPVTPRKNWDERYQQLIEYKEIHGNCDVPQLHPELGTWVHHQRRHYRRLKLGRKSHITKERIDKLVALGFKWITRKSPKPIGENDDRLLDLAKSPNAVKKRKQQHQDEESSSSSDNGDDDDDDDSSVGHPIEYNRSSSRGKQIQTLWQQTTAPARAGYPNYHQAQQQNAAPWERYRISNDRTF